MKTFSMRYALPATIKDADNNDVPLLDPATQQPYAPITFTITLATPVAETDQSLAQLFGLQNFSKVAVDFDGIDIARLGLASPMVQSGPGDRVLDMTEVALGKLFVANGAAPYLTGSGTGSVCGFLSETEYNAKWNGVTLFDPANGQPGGMGDGGGGSLAG